MAATAAVRRRCDTRDAATTEPMPKKAPCGIPARKRAAMTVGYVFAARIARCATAKKAMSPMSRPLRGALANAMAMSGAPTTTPRA